MCKHIHYLGIWLRDQGIVDANKQTHPEVLNDDAEGNSVVANTPEELAPAPDTQKNSDSSLLTREMIIQKFVEIIDEANPSQYRWIHDKLMAPMRPVIAANQAIHAGVLPQVKPAKGKVQTQNRICECE